MTCDGWVIGMTCDGWVIGMTCDGWVIGMTCDGWVIGMTCDGWVIDMTLEFDMMWGEWVIGIDEVVKLCITVCHVMEPLTSLMSK